MNRKLNFGAAEAGADEDGTRNARVREILKGLIGALGSKERYEIDGALISTDLKFAEKPVPGESTKTEGEPPKGDILGIADQVILSWAGEPLGVDCAVPGKAKENTPDNLPFGRTVDLPSDNEKNFARRTSASAGFSASACGRFTRAVSDRASPQQKSTTMPL